MRTKFLFPYSFKRIGWIILLPSTILGILILFFNLKFEFLDSKVFAIYSKEFFAERPTYFGLTPGNYTQTIAGLLFLLGALFVAFSKERHEDEFIAKITVGITGLGHLPQLCHSGFLFSFLLQPAVSDGHDFQHVYHTDLLYCPLLLYPVPHQQIPDK